MEALRFRGSELISLSVEVPVSVVCSMLLLIERGAWAESVELVVPYEMGGVGGARSVSLEAVELLGLLVPLVPLVALVLFTL